MMKVMKLKDTDRIIFKKGKQSKFIRLAAKNIGSLRKLSHLLNKKWGHLYYYVCEKYSLSFALFQKILSFTKLTQEEVLQKWVKTIKPRNWGSIKGAIEANKIIQRKLKKSRKYRKAWIEKCRKGGISSIRINGIIKNWDIGFRRVGRRNVIGPNGERMFNNHEKRIAEYLITNGFQYEYEPCIKIRSNTYFPDFIVDDILIERCGFVTKEHMKRLRKKIIDYINYWNGKIIIIGPKRKLKIIRKILPSSTKIFIIVEDKIGEMARLA